jgi:hypothetical protein
MTKRRTIMLFRKYGVPGLVALVLLLPAGLFSAGCSSKPGKDVSPTPPPQKDHPVKLVVEDHPQKGKRWAKADPDTVIVYGYASGGAGRTITWNYTNSSTSIRFHRNELPEPDCTTNKNKCTLVIPDGLLRDGEDLRPFKYIVSGMEGSTKLEDNDPFVVIER